MRQTSTIIAKAAALFYLTVCIALHGYSQCGTLPTAGTTTINSVGSVVNSYYPGAASVVSGSSSITVGTRDPHDAGIAIGTNDLILVIQMQGADINSANSVAYGGSNSSAPANGYTANTNLVAGYYEYANVSSVSGSTISLTYPLTNSYYARSFTSTNAIQAFQVIRIPRSYNLVINASKSIVATPWNGQTGGVVVLDAANAMTINGTISVNGLGFRGGGGKNLLGATSGNTNGSGPVTNTDYRWNSFTTTPANTTGGAKGEGFAGTPIYTYVVAATSTATGTLEGYINGSIGRGAPGNAGGGGTDGEPDNNPSGNQYNSGGGGGSNAGAGGQGGSGWPGTGGDVTTFPTGGYGAAAFTQRGLQRVIMGGGGGAGTANNSSTSNESNCSGGIGGGIIIARAKSYAGNGILDAGGASAPGVTTTYATAQTDAAGGGGAGGTIVVVTTQAGVTGLNSISAVANGGGGGYMTTYYNHGPGGGGGGGVVYTNGTLASTNVTGGANGLTRSGSPTGTIDNAYGAHPGANGTTITIPGPPTFLTSTGGAGPCGILPILLESFTASIDDKSVVLKWKADHEINFDFFSVEYSANGATFTEIGQVDYNNGTAQYTFIHHTPQPGQNFYRLRLIDKDGRYSYSPVLSVNLNETTGNLFSIYPNPAYNALTLQFQVPAAREITFQLYDNSGKLVRSNSYAASQGQNYLSVGDISNLPAGIYLVRVDTKQQVFTQTLLIGSRK